MTVYILLASYNAHCNSVVLGVFSSVDAAKQAAKGRERYDRMEIVTERVDSPYHHSNTDPITLWDR